MIRRLRLVAFLLLPACSTEPAPDEPSDARRAAPVEDTKFAPPPVSVRPETLSTLTQTSIPDGTTNTGTQPPLNFAMRNLAQAELDRVVRWLEAHAVIRGPKGERVTIGAAAMPLPSSESTFSHVIQITPSQELALDRWYSLDVSISADVNLVDSDGELYRDGVFQTRFFTGSAPRVRKMSLRPDNSLEIVFSEPVELGTLAAGLAIAAGTTTLAGCATHRGHCLVPEHPVVSDHVEYRFDSPFKLEGAPLRVSLSDAVSGSARTVGEARAAAALVTPHAVVDRTGWRMLGDGRREWKAPLSVALR
jgi:hypothetical protein